MTWIDVTICGCNHTALLDAGFRPEPRSKVARGDVGGPRAARPRPPLAPVHPDAGLGARRAADHRARRGQYLIDVDGRRYLDGVSSLWCNVHGHREPGIDAAIRAQLDRVAHTTLLGLSHPGAIELAARLSSWRPGPLARLLLRLRLHRGRGRAEDRLPVLAPARRPHARIRRPREAYHGDTLGSVSVGGIDLFHGPTGRSSSRPTPPSRATRPTSSGSSPATRRRSRPWSSSR